MEIDLSSIAAAVAPRHHPVAVDWRRSAVSTSEFTIPLVISNACQITFPCRDMSSPGSSVGPPYSGKPTAVGSLISVEHPLDLLGVGRLGQRQHQQDTGLLRVKRI